MEYKETIVEKRKPGNTKREITQGSKAQKRVLKSYESCVKDSGVVVCYSLIRNFLPFQSVPQDETLPKPINPHLFSASRTFRKNLLLKPSDIS